MAIILGARLGRVNQTTRQGNNPSGDGRCRPETEDPWGKENEKHAASSGKLRFWGNTIQREGGMAEGRQERRRLAAIMATDVVGYSGRMEADEDGTFEQVQRLHGELVEPAVRRNHGRVVKSMGDGLLVEFASVVSAVDCGIQILDAQKDQQDPSRYLPIRIGVNLGDVIHEGGDIFGDGVNVAARLQEIAPTNALVISEDVVRQLRGKLNLSYTDLGQKKLKNIKREVRAYLVSTHKVRSPLTDGASQPAGWKSRRSLVVGSCLLALAISAMVAILVARPSGTTAECLDHLGLPVAAEECAEQQ